MSIGKQKTLIITIVLIWHYNANRYLIKMKYYCIVSKGKRRRLDFLWKSDIPFGVGNRLELPELFSASLGRRSHFSSPPLRGGTGNAPNPFHAWLLCARVVDAAMCDLRLCFFPRFSLLHEQLIWPLFMYRCRIPRDRLCGGNWIGG